MFITRTNSTNTLLKELIAAGDPPQYIYAGYQTAGRGQAGNGWESEEGKNLLCSILLPPRKELFELNVVVSVAVCLLVKKVIERSGLCSLSEAVSIKWPNDIYWQDKKIAGILIENAIIGNEVRYSIAGIGLNVNQTEWKSDAPNPISLKQVTGKEWNVDELMESLVQEVEKALKEDVWYNYRAHLYRREGIWPFAEREVSPEPSRVLTTTPQNMFMASIEDVTKDGKLVLKTAAGLKAYHFKEIQFVL